MHNLIARKNLFLVVLFAVLMTSCGDPDKAAAPGTPLSAPTVLSVTPINTPFSCPNNVGAISATFSKAMNPATLISPATTFTVTGPGSTSVAGTVTYTSATNTATFTPTGVLAPNTLYTATISTAAMDVFGVRLAANSVWTFTTSPTCAPTITKAFNPTTIPLGATTSLTFTITNPAANPIALTGVGFTDNLPVGLQVASSSVSTCGGTLTTTLPTGIVLSGATIAANSQCVFSVTVTGAFSGNYTNTTGTVSSTNGGTGNAATANLIVASPPAIAKAFNPTTIPQTGTTLLTFTLTNPPANLFALTGVGFSDTLPLGLTVASSSIPNTCGTGTLTTTAATRTIVLTGGTIAASSQCSFGVTVTGVVSGSYTNTTGNVSSTNGGTGLAASANLVVASPPVIAKAFVPNSIAPGATSALTFTITNPVANAFSLAGVAFTDTLPINVVVSTPNGIVGSCGAGTITATAGSGSISLSGGTVSAGSNCSFSVNVTSAVLGNYTNTTSAVTSTNAGTGNTASANLSVAIQPTALASNCTVAILASTPVVSNIGPTIVSGGEVEISPAASITGFGGTGLGPPGMVVLPFGISHAGDAVAATARAQAMLAYNSAGTAQGGTFGTGTGLGAVLTADIGGQTKFPGVYRTTSAQPSLGITGTLTLDGNGDPNSVFIFQIGSSLITAAGNSQIILQNGATANHVFWQVGTSATLGVNVPGVATIFQGTILASASITLNTGAVLNGRALALNGAVTMDSNTVTVPPGTCQ